MKNFKIFVFVCCCISGVSNGQHATSRNFFTYDGASMYYEEQGEGEPLLLLHTFYGTTKQWDGLRNQYSEKFRVIAVDLFGHGKSDVYFKSKEYKSRDCAKAILALMDHLKIEKARAMGASLGGMVLLYANYLQPHRFKSVALIGAQIYIGSGTRKWIREERADSANQKYVSYYNDLHGPDKAKLLMRQFWNYQFSHEELAITPDMLQTMTANFLVVQGDNDFIGLFNALEMHQYIPQSHLWIYPNGGHLPHLNKNNSEDFAKRTLEFFAGSWNVMK